jgi:ribosomal-protein-alanine N-acetyltransferase
MSLFETERLILRLLHSGDREFILSLVNDPSFIENIGDRGVRTLEDAETYIAKIETSYRQNGYGLYLTALKDSNTPVGMCGLVKRDTLPEPDIGFAFLPKFWRNGYALESAQAVLHYARHSLRLKTVLGITSPENTGSIRVLEKIGLTYQATTELVPNDPVKIFSLTFPGS